MPAAVLEAELVRRWFTKASTIGELTLGKVSCFTLEDTVREGPKVYGETAIPAGRYELVINKSKRFGRLMPRLLDVPGFDGILIHWGNSNVDTKGCPLVGRTHADDWVGESKLAFQAFFKELGLALRRGRVFLTIREERSE